MSLSGDIKNGADDAIQKAFGTTPPSLAGARFARLVSFASQELSKQTDRQPIVDTGPQKRGVESQTTIVPSNPIPPTEPAAPIPPTDSAASGGTQQFIVDMNGTLEFWDFTAKFNSNV